MFDDISDLDNVNISEVKILDNNKDTRQSYSKNDYSKNNNSGGRPQFKRKEEVLEEPYIPVTMYVDSTFPQEVKEKLYNIASRLINKKVTVRINGDDKEFIERLSKLSDSNVEIYIPWKGFNDLDTKHSWNTITSKHIAQTNFQAWDKIPDSVKSLMARNVRMVFGDKNNSITLCVITWSPDGASRGPEVTKDTGRSSFIIKMASRYSFPVVNTQKQNAENILEKSFEI